MTSEAACPHCRCSLNPSSHDAATLLCGQCGGQFVLPGSVRAEFMEPATRRETDESRSQAPFPCPGCGGAMVVVELAEKPLERCQQCGGLWLDAGEDLAVATEAAGSSVGGMFLYTLSLPERLLRSTVGMAGGVAKELSDRLVPGAFQNSNTYTILVQNSLKFLVHAIGGVQGPQTDEDASIDNYVARKAVGNFVELVGIATLHLSPMLILAVLSDVAYGSKTYLEELGEVLRKEGLIDKDSTIGNVDDLLEAVSRASGTTAKLFDTPPLSVADLRSTIGSIQESLTSIDPTQVLPQAEIRRLWDEMHAVARRDDVNLFQVSSAMTLHALGKIADVGRGTFFGMRLAASMVNRHILGYYATALEDLQKKGFYATLNEVSTPYLDAVWNNFCADKETLTQEVLTGRLPARMLRTLKGWFRRKPSETFDPTEENQ